MRVNLKLITIMNRIFNLFFLFCCFFSINLCAQSQDNNVLSFLNLRFGMFIHYNMGTYSAEQWAYPFHDPVEFKPSDLDCKQWATAAKSAGMNYAVLTTKHHDGFCLWDSKVTNYDISSAEKKYKKTDVVKQYVDAFREEGIAIGLYYSIWDRHQGIEHKNINKNNIEFMKQQLTELLTNYGEIRCLVLDGWGSLWGEGPDFEELPYHILSDHIHSIQPNCLVINHSCQANLDYTQIVHYEATHGQHIPFDNTFPSQQGPVIQPTWFWEKGYENLELKPVDEIINEMTYTNKHYSNYLLNAAPNNKGLMDANVVKRLKEVGEKVKVLQPLTSIPAIQKPHKNVTVKVSSVSDKQNDLGSNVIDCNLFTKWRPSKNDDTPWVELDFGENKTFNYFSMHGGYNKAIQSYEIEAFLNNKWVNLYTGKVARFNDKGKLSKDVKAQKYRLRITKKNGIPEVVELTFADYE